MRTRTLMVTVLVLLLAAASTAAWANDKITSTVTITQQQRPGAIQDNGLVSGNIRINYVYSGTQWPCSNSTSTPFAQFNLALETSRGTGQTGSSTTLTLAGTGGGTPVQLVANPNQFSVTSGVYGPLGTPVVSVYIGTPNSDGTVDCSKVPTNPQDGDVIDGQLNYSTGSGTHWSTITSIQVHITLAFPSEENCLKLYSFESDQDTGQVLTSVTVQESGGQNPKITNVTPGQISVDGMVYNNCGGPRSFDLLIGLGSFFATNPIGNPGNATFVYTYAGMASPDTYTLTAFGTGTPEGQAVCLTYTLPDQYTFLARVHSQNTIKGEDPSVLNGITSFDFSAALYQAGSGCTGSYLTGVGPKNPATSSLSF